MSTILAQIDKDYTCLYEQALREGVKLTRLLTLAVLSNHMDDAKSIGQMIVDRRFLIHTYNESIVRGFERYQTRLYKCPHWLYLRTMSIEQIMTQIDGFIERVCLLRDLDSLRAPLQYAPHSLPVSRDKKIRKVKSHSETSAAEKTEQKQPSPPPPSGTMIGKVAKKKAKQKRPYNSFQTASQITEEGVKISWASNKRPPKRWEGRKNYYRPEHEKGIREQIREEVALGRIKEVSIHEAKHVAPLGSVTRSSDKSKPRPIMDMRLLNSHLEHYAVNLPDKEAIIKAIQGMKWAIVKDLKNGYYNLKLHKDSIGWCSFEFDGKCYTYNVLCFGLSTAPAAFVTVTRDVVEKSRAESTLVYVDEFLIMGRTKEECLNNNRLLENEIAKRKMVFNEKKSMSEPAQIVDFIGYKLNLKEGLVYNKDSRVEKLYNEWQKIKSATTTTKGRMMKFLGKLNFAITNKRYLIYLREAYWLFQMRNKSERSREVPMTKSVVSSIERALGCIKFTHQVSIFSRPPTSKCTHVITTDASSFACGIVSTNVKTATTHIMAIKLPKLLQRVRQASTFKEAIAILLAVLLADERAEIRILTDCLNICDIFLNLHMFKSKNVNAIWDLFIDTVEEKGISVDIQFIPGKDNPADRPSRLRSLDEWGYKYVEKTFADSDHIKILHAEDILAGAGMYDAVMRATQGYSIMDQRITPLGWKRPIN